MGRQSWMRLALLAGGLAAALVACEGGEEEVAILNIDPQVGHTQGEQQIKIVGENFRQDIGYTVYFGKQKAGSVTIMNPETLVATTPSRDDPGNVDVLIRADNGPAFRIPQGFKYEKMQGSVVEGLGEQGESKKEEKGNLQY